MNKFYLDQDETGTWLLFSEETGFCHASYCEQEEAIAKCAELNALTQEDV